jgi:hypothetical protein
VGNISPQAMDDPQDGIAIADGGIRLFVVNIV